MKNKSNVGKTAVFLNPLYPSLHRKACKIVNDWLQETAYNTHRYGVRFPGDEKSMAAKECEILF